MSAIQMILARIAQSEEQIKSQEDCIKWSEQSILRSQGIIHTLQSLLDDLRAEIDMKPIMELMKDGRKIDAIRAYRAESGCGLKESKDYIESYYQNHCDKLGETLGDILDKARQNLA